jgi:hypothetical protein
MYMTLGLVSSTMLMAKTPLQFPLGFKVSLHQINEISMSLLSNLISAVHMRFAGMTTIFRTKLLAHLINRDDKLRIIISGPIIMKSYLTL